ncbi:MAG TPA: SHOCT domain-containing protein [Thermodesulfovibrionales bacterium]|nr:SHOCT domain-containing protein [Thermodesulfovibrionales bacterium]
MKKRLFFLIVGVPFLPTLGYAVESWERSFYWRLEPSSFGAGTFFLIPIFFMIAFWIAVVIGFAYFVKWIIAAGKRRETKSEETALDILKKRYAKGELSKEDFERMKQDIQ